MIKSFIQPTPAPLHCLLLASSFHHVLCSYSCDVAFLHCNVFHPHPNSTTYGSSPHHFSLAFLYLLCNVSHPFPCHRGWRLRLLCNFHIDVHNSQLHPTMSYDHTISALTFLTLLQCIPPLLLQALSLTAVHWYNSANSFIFFSF